MDFRNQVVEITHHGEPLVRLHSNEDGLFQVEIVGTHVGLNGRPDLMKKVEQ